MPALRLFLEVRDAVGVGAPAAWRSNEIDEPLVWVGEQEPTADLLRRTALRWGESTGRERVQGMRFAHADRSIMQKLAAEGTDRRSRFDAVVDAVLPTSTTQADRLRAQMAFDTVSAALFAARGTAASDDDVLTAVRDATVRLKEAESTSTVRHCIGLGASQCHRGRSTPPSPLPERPERPMTDRQRDVITNGSMRRRHRIRTLLPSPRLRPVRAGAFSSMSDSRCDRRRGAR